MKSLIEKQEEETEMLVTIILSKDFKTREELEKDGEKTYKKFLKMTKDFVFTVRKESIEFERERIKKIIKEMPDTFPELESDSYDLGYKEAKEYILIKLK